MIMPLLVSAVLMTLTVIIHMVGLILLMGFLQARSRRLRPFESPVRQGIFIVTIMLGLVVIHAIEIWIYTVFYTAMGIFPDMGESLYYSISTFTTVGFGDVNIESDWRIVGALESFNGFLLIGWSTAFLVAVIGRMRSMEMDWLDRLREGID
ncbi:ion channel [Hyphobacterium sp. HN65]|uniref:Ion channel n=1 Tax=Hyphobacterium lacteum TaxID=3116575 RepID=A0ABU7LMM3_9PROT|nr:ion channel [Hyphobacterium sp. HN65]MEE2525176.1 ion channel [Hyphobacterium sp. HN65]